MKTEPPGGSAVNTLSASVPAPARTNVPMLDYAHTAGVKFSKCSRCGCMHYCRQVSYVTATMLAYPQAVISSTKLNTTDVVKYVCLLCCNAPCLSLQCGVSEGSLANTQDQLSPTCQGRRGRNRPWGKTALGV